MPDRPTATEELGIVAAHLIDQTASAIGTDDPEKIAAQLRLDLVEFPQFAEPIREALRRLESRNGR